jgi:hypothetical protein
MRDRIRPQLLHLVIGGEVIDFEHPTFKDIDKVETVGLFPSYEAAHAAWKAKAQQTVDNAHTRYFICISTAFWTRPTTCRPRPERNDDDYARNPRAWSSARRRDARG